MTKKRSPTSSYSSILQELRIWSIRSTDKKNPSRQKNVWPATTGLVSTTTTQVEPNYLGVSFKAFGILVNFCFYSNVVMKTSRKWMSFEWPLKVATPSQKTNRRQCCCCCCPPWDCFNGRRWRDFDNEFFTIYVFCHFMAAIHALFGDRLSSERSLLSFRFHDWPFFFLKKNLSVRWGFFSTTIFVYVLPHHFGFVYSKMNRASDL